MTLKFMNLEGLERNFQPWKQTRKRMLLKLTLSVKTTHFTSKFTAFYHCFTTFATLSRGIWPAWKWDRGNVWPPINGVIWLDFIIVASLCYKTWISLKNISFKRYITKSVIRSATVRFIHGLLHVGKSELW